MFFIARNTCVWGSHVKHGLPVIKSKKTKAADKAAHPRSMDGFILFSTTKPPVPLFASGCWHVGLAGLFVSVCCLLQQVNLSPSLSPFFPLLLVPPYSSFQPPLVLGNHTNKNISTWFTYLWNQPPFFLPARDNMALYKVPETKTPLKVCGLSR